VFDLALVDPHIEAARSKALDDRENLVVIGTGITHEDVTHAATDLWFSYRVSYERLREQRARLPFRFWPGSATDLAER
jgi:hypothetical protein